VCPADMVASRVATPGETNTNRVTGERLTFIRTPEASEGRALELHRGGARASARGGAAPLRRAARHRPRSSRERGRGPLRIRQWVELGQPEVELLEGIARYFETSPPWPAGAAWTGAG
ncbi:MAG TPA: hypothetical protein VLA62_01920, partial [Solirubrobacterales bacterium]|nr:hypothetical protein [Solirubrobacterales bacterium]